MTFWNRIGRFAAPMLLAIAVASCDHTETPLDVGAPQQVAGQPQELLGLDPLLSSVTTVEATDQYGNVRSYELIREPILTLDPSALQVSQLIGVNGGTITLLGHRMVVPSGAVDLPTLFTLSVLNNGYVHVDVSALAPGMSGLIDVGEQGFNRPVRLDLTYSRATNVKNERRLVILRMNPNGMGAMHEALPSSVDRTRDKVTVFLEHFSGYCMAQ